MWTAGSPRLRALLFHPISHPRGDTSVRARVYSCRQDEQTPFPCAAGPRAAQRSALAYLLFSNCRRNESSVTTVIESFRSQGLNGIASTTMTGLTFHRFQSFIPSQVNISFRCFLTQSVRCLCFSIIDFVDAVPTVKV